MNIVILDDEAKSIEYCKLMMEHFGLKYQMPISVSGYTSSEVLLNDKNRMEADVMFIDIGLGDADGMDVAKKLRADDYSGDIIFFTRHYDRVLDAFDVDAMHYIIKGETKPGKIEEIFNKATTNYKKRNRDMVVFQNKNGIRKIAVDSILYFEVRNRIITVHYNDKSFDFYSTLGKVEFMMSEFGFIRCHKSFIVSKKAIVGIDLSGGRYIKLVNGTEIPIGRSYKAVLDELDVLNV